MNGRRRGREREWMGGGEGGRMNGRMREGRKRRRKDEGKMREEEEGRRTKERRSEEEGEGRRDLGRGIERKIFLAG